MTAAATWSGQDLQLELLDPGSQALVRLFSRAGGEWAEPPAAYRNLRVDPPAGAKDSFAVLYTGNTLAAVAMECRILNVDVLDNYTWNADLAAKFRVARYRFGAPALFIPIDGMNRRTLGLSGSQRPFAGYAPYQQVAHELFRRYGHTVHGLSWESFHRNQPGRVYAIWHHHKSTIGLATSTKGPYPTLIDDGEWMAFLGENLGVKRIGS